MAKQILVTAPRKIEVRDVPNEPLEPGMARVEAHYFGISIGTEMNTYRGGVNWHAGRDPETRLFHPDAEKYKWEYPATVGYSPVGRVTEVASDVTNVKIGDMVYSLLHFSNSSVPPPTSCITPRRASATRWRSLDWVWWV